MNTGRIIQNKISRSSGIAWRNINKSKMRFSKIKFVETLEFLGELFKIKFVDQGVLLVKKFKDEKAISFKNVCRSTGIDR